MFIYKPKSTNLEYLWEEIFLDLLSMTRQLQKQLVKKIHQSLHRVSTKTVKQQKFESESLPDKLPQSTHYSSM